MDIQVFTKPGTEGRVTLRAYIPDIMKQIQHNYDRPALLVIPGGAYRFCSDREAEPIACHFLTAGVTCFVLEYSTAPYAKFPAPLLDAMWAMNLIRENANLFRIDPHKVGVIGFSAGGHLAASLSVFWNNEEYAKMAGVSTANLRPDAAILSYPVITAERDIAHLGSFENLLVEETDNEEMRRYVSLENRVHADVPPCFIWHTCNDESVPVENSLVFARALSKYEIPYEMHIFQDGVHGLSLALKHTAKDASQINHDAARWAPLATNWLMNTLGYID